MPAAAPPPPDRRLISVLRKSFRNYKSLFFADTSKPKFGICFSSDATVPSDFTYYVEAVRRAEQEALDMGEPPTRRSLPGATILWEENSGTRFAFICSAENASPPNLRSLAKWLRILKAHEEMRESK